MLEYIFFLLSFVVSTLAYGFGMFYICGKNAPKYFQLYVYAAGCYMLEELWGIVDFLLGSGGSDGYLTVRLFGFFGCLAFMLSANNDQFDKVVDEGRDEKARVFALLAPLFLIILFVYYVLLINNDRSAIFVFVSYSPALLGAYYSLKHLLLPTDALGLLKTTRSIDIMTLVFYILAFIYLLVKTAHRGIFGLVIAISLFGIIVLCKKGADKWKTLI